MYKRGVHRTLKQVFRKGRFGFNVDHFL